MTRSTRKPASGNPMSITSVLNNDYDEHNKVQSTKQQSRQPDRRLRQETRNQDLPDTQDRQQQHPGQLPMLAAQHISNRSESLQSISPHTNIGPTSYLTVTVRCRETRPPSRPPPNGDGRGSITRPHRPKYEEEQAMFVWYHRKDLNEPWTTIVCEFERQFLKKRKKGGLQCKYYRTLGEWNVEKVRNQIPHPHERPDEVVPRYGVIERTNRRYRWMRPQHYRARCLPEFDGIRG